MLDRSRSVSHALRSALACTALRAASWLPFGALQTLGRGIGGLLAHVPARACGAARVNLRLCFPELAPAERARLAHESVRQSTCAMLELGALWHWERERVLALVREVVGLETLDAAARAGRGVVLLGAHLGAWELVGLFVGARMPLTSLYRPPRVRRLEGLYRAARERFGARLVPARASGVRELFRALRRGEVVGFLPDQDPGRDSGVFAPFFGVPANTSALPAKLLAATGAVPLFTWAERLASGDGFRLHFVEPSSDALASANVELATRALNAELERLIRRRPQQYLWTYRRFRRRPAGLRDPYREGSAPEVATPEVEAPAALAAPGALGEP